jgi:hypothetical protein
MAKSADASPATLISATLSAVIDEKAPVDIAKAAIASTARTGNSFFIIICLLLLVFHHKLLVPYKESEHMVRNSVLFSSFAVSIRDCRILPYEKRGGIKLPIGSNHHAVLSAEAPM